MVIVWSGCGCGTLGLLVLEHAVGVVRAWQPYAEMKRVIVDKGQAYGGFQAESRV